MEPSLDTQLPPLQTSDPHEAWQMVLGQLHQEMARVNFETWVQNLRLVGYAGGVFTVSTVSTATRDWVESHLRSRITRILEAYYGSGVAFRVAVGSAAHNSVLQAGSQPAAAGRPEANAAPSGEPASPPAADPAPDVLPGGRSRKLMLQRAYGSQRARVIQPERGLFLTLYFFENWLPLLGHSAMAVILAARSLCYWNPMTGELRNEVETEMGELARRAAVSLRTVKDVLNQELVRRYFLRYRVRRMMTPNGVRTAGILLLVRMDDPLTPEDQDAHALPEEERWYPANYEDEGEE